MSTENTTDNSRQNGDAPTRRFQKLTAVLSPKEKIIFEGIDSTMEAVRQAVKEFLRRVEAASRQGIQLPTFLAILRDQAER